MGAQSEQTSQVFYRDALGQEQSELIADVEAALLRREAGPGAEPQCLGGTRLASLDGSLRHGRDDSPVLFLREGLEGRG